MEASFFRLSLRRLGFTFWMEAEPTDSRVGPDHAHWHLRPVRFRTEAEALRALEAAQIGMWSGFPPEGVYATLSRTQLRTLGFRGNL